MFCAGPGKRRYGVTLLLHRTDFLKKSVAQYASEIYVCKDQDVFNKVEILKKRKVIYFIISLYVYIH